MDTPHRLVAGNTHTPHSLNLYREKFLVWIMTPIWEIPVRGFFANVNGNDFVSLYMLEWADCGHSMPKVFIGTIFVADVVVSMMVIIYLHYTYTRHQDVCGERTTHHKWNSKEDIYWYTQYQTTDHNTKNNLHCKSCPQFWRPTSHQASYCVV